jgi:cephalosporin hydroxylase
MTEFEDRNLVLTAAMEADVDLRTMSREWMIHSARYEYSYHFTWLGRPIIQFPQDILAVQELVWSVRPDLIVETGIARGGSLILSASLLELLGGDGLVVGIDIDMRRPNREAIESHPLAHRVRIVEGSSTAPEVLRAVEALASGRDRVMVMLDSNHTHDHVLAELELYSPLVKSGSYLIVFDTIIDEMPAGSFPDRPWDVGNNPATAVRAFLDRNNRFEVDQDIEKKLLISVAPGGYLKCVG